MSTREQDVFEVLNIDPTDDFTRVKKAYYCQALQYHPDKGGSTEDFQRLEAAWEQVNNYDKLQQYYASRDTAVQSQFSASTVAPDNESYSATASSENFTTNELATGLRMDVYVPVPLWKRSGRTAWQQGGVLSDLKDESINWKEFAAWLANQNEPMQVGVTFEEALRIQGQQNQMNAMAIMCISVPMASLSLDRKTFGEMIGVDNEWARSRYQDSYISLAANTHIHAAEITSVQGAPISAMGCLRTIGVSPDRDLQNIWPHGVELQDGKKWSGEYDAESGIVSAPSVAHHGEMSNKTFQFKAIENPMPKLAPALKGLAEFLDEYAATIQNSHAPSLRHGFLSKLHAAPSAQQEVEAAIALLSVIEKGNTSIEQRHVDVLSHPIGKLARAFNQYCKEHDFASNNEPVHSARVLLNKLHVTVVPNQEQESTLALTSGGRQ